MKKIFLICPVRNASDEQKEKMKVYISNLENNGVKVYYPTRNNSYELTDTIGYIICSENTKAIREADEIHIFWDKNSSGSLFDLGAAFILNKHLVIANVDEVEQTETKSFSNMIREWAINH